MTKDEIIGRLNEFKDLAVAALTCLVEAILGKEVSCPPCWKCTTLRWIFGLALAYGLYAVLGGWFVLLAVALLLYLLSFGEGFWRSLREALIAARGKGE